MIANRTDGFDDRLAPAISAKDPADALQALRRRPADDPELTRQVRAALELIDDLSALRERIDQAPLPPLALPELADRRRARLRWLAPAAAVAAAAVLAIGLLSISPPPGPDGGTQAGQEPVALTVEWDIPAIEPVSLAEHEFSLPEIALPSLASMEFTWSVPSLEIPPASAGEDADGPDATTKPAASFDHPDRKDPLLAA
ncbi:MAG TPA: hypothetical protein VFJ30_10165 [Phycisphaerae bacterium]|nr:hypothetical protein [Phycisphaerae bacterium]